MAGRYDSPTLGNQHSGTISSGEQRGSDANTDCSIDNTAVHTPDDSIASTPLVPNFSHPPLPRRGQHTDNNLKDLEKAHTAPDISGLSSSLSSNVNQPVLERRVTRIQSLGGKRPSFQHPLKRLKTGPEVLVNFDGDDDPYHPRNWPMRKKVWTTILYGLTTMGATFASSVYSPAVGAVSNEFFVTQEVSLLGVSLLLAGFGLGPLLWAPVSEIYGRKPAVLMPFFVGAIFSFGTGSAANIQTVLITRFFTGIFASAPVTNTGGVLSDIWDPTQRGTAIVGYALAVVGGPTLGPIVGGAIIARDVSWRWTQYVTGIYMLLILLVDVLVLEESYAPVILTQKASRLRHKTGNWALHSKHEEWDFSVLELAHKFGVRPFQMLLTPICFFVAVYASFCYGILYGNLAAFPIVFQRGRGWNPFIGSLPFLSLLVGIIIGGILNILNQQFYNRRFVQNDKRPVPEARLPPMMLGSIFFAGGLFMFGWTADPSLPWILPVIGAGLVGVGFFTIFQGALNYLIDCFQTYSASAIAANTFLRSAFAMAFPLFIDPMYQRLGYGWATSIFGFVAVCMIPIPFVFYIYGPWIRRWGRFSANMG